MKNRKGFTLVELIAVIVILALLAAIGIPAYNSIRKSVLEKQYKNLVALIETNATKLASSKDINITNVQELIDEGLLETDDGENIYDPRDKSIMNCFLIEVEYSNDTYTSDLLDIKNCDLEAARKSFGKIKIMATGDETNKVITFSESKNNWVKENVTLSVDLTKITDSIDKYRWVVANGKTGTETTMKMSTKKILNTNVNVEVTTIGGEKYFAKTPVRIDKESPLIMDIEVGGGNKWKNGKIVTIKASDQKGSGIAGYYIGKKECNASTSFTKKTATKYETKIDAEEFDKNDQDFYMCVIDKVGNITSKKTTLSMTDKTGPECVWSGESTKWTKNNRTITLTCEDSESGCAKGYEKFSETFDTSTKTRYMSYIIKDRAGNTTTCNKEVNVYVDKDSPYLDVEFYKWATNDDSSRPTTITYSNLGEYTPNTWSDKKIFTIALGQDYDSGNLTYTYTTTGKTTNNTNKSGRNRNIEAQGISTIQYKVCDQAGNCTTSDVYTVKIDRSGPTAPTMNFSYGDWRVYPNNTWTKNNVYAGRTSSSKGPTGSIDSGIGLSHYEISKDGTTWVSYNYDSTSDMYKMSTTGTHTRYFRAVDKLGNASPITTLTAKIDKADPALVVKIYKWTTNDDSSKPTTTTYSNLGEYTPNTWSDKKLFTIATGEDSGSGNLTYTYTTTGVTTNNTNTSGRSRNIEAQGVSTIQYKACDAVGNCTTSDVYTVKIDRAGPTTPTMNFVYGDWTVYPNNTWTKNNVYAGRTASGDHGPTGSVDYGIGLSHYEISKDGTNWVRFNYDYNNDMYKMSTTGTHTRYFRAVDKLGKASSTTTLTAKIDNQAPTVPTVVLKKWANNSTQPTSSNYTTLDNYTSGTETDKKVYTYATSTDSHSGGIEYYYTTTGATTNATDYNARSRNIEAMGTSYIKYKACDAVGNCSNYTPVYTIIRKNSVTISGNIAEWVCGKCTNACTLDGDKPYRAKNSNGEVIFAVDGRCGNTVGKVTYTASGNKVTFNWEIRQGAYTYIYSSYWVKFIIKNSSKTLHTETLKSGTGSNWGGGSVHKGTLDYTFVDKGTYYIYIDGNSSDPGFDMNFGTITVS